VHTDDVPEAFPAASITYLHPVPSFGGSDVQGQPGSHRHKVVHTWEDGPWPEQEGLHDGAILPEYEIWSSTADIDRMVFINLEGCECKSTVVED